MAASRVLAERGWHGARVSKFFFPHSTEKKKKVIGPCSSRSGRLLGENHHPAQSERLRPPEIVETREEGRSANYHVLYNSRPFRQLTDRLHHNADVVCMMTQTMFSSTRHCCATDTTLSWCHSPSQLLRSLCLLARCLVKLCFVVEMRAMCLCIRSGIVIA